MILSKEFKIKIRTFNCTECERFHSEAYYNCTKTYSDCRHYRKNSWRAIDKQVNEVRKQVFEELIKNV